MTEWGLALRGEPSRKRETTMKSKLTYVDFGYPDEKTFDLAKTCGPIVRFEIRKLKGDVKHAENRLELARLVGITEREQAMAETSMVKFIDKWVEMYESELKKAEEKLAFMRKVIEEYF